MDDLFNEFVEAYSHMNGYRLAATLTPKAPASNPDKLVSFWRSANAQNVKHEIRFRILYDNNNPLKLSAEEGNGWAEVYLCYWKALGEIIAMEEDGDESRSTWTKVYEAWKELTLMLIRGYTNHGFDAWTIPSLYATGKYLRIYAMKSDEERNGSSNDNSGMILQDDFDAEAEKHQQLEDCARQLNRIFNICLSDRAPLEDSRKWGIYYAINLLFKTYFKLNSASLSRNVLKALSAYKGDMPPLSAFPKSQQVTFKYYEGVLTFLEENYVEAEKHLTMAWMLCHKDAHHNKELILTYLIPAHLLTTHTLPSAALLAPYPRLSSLFLPLASAIRRGDLSAFDSALRQRADALVQARIYLTLERGRDVALRNLLRRVFVAGGWVDEPPKDGEAAAAAGGEPPKVRRTRVPVMEFVVAVSLASAGALTPKGERNEAVLHGEGEEEAGREGQGKETEDGAPQETVPLMDPDEVECLLANMIYKGLMKGYIARERGIVVLSKAGAFPGTGV